MIAGQTPGLVTAPLILTGKVQRQRWRLVDELLAFFAYAGLEGPRGAPEVGSCERVPVDAELKGIGGRYLDPSMFAIAAQIESFAEEARVSGFTRRADPLAGVLCGLQG